MSTSEFDLPARAPAPRARPARAVGDPAAWPQLVVGNELRSFAGR